VSAAGGIGVVQPLSMIYVYGHDLRAGFQLIRRITDKPIGMNVLIERSSKLYLERMRRYVDVAVEEGVRFFVTSLGNPRWVVDRVAPAGGIVYHDVTERKWAEKGLAGGVHGLIAVNDRAGGHAGPYSAERLYEQLHDLGVPIVCAGGIGDEHHFVRALLLPRLTEREHEEPDLEAARFDNHCLECDGDGIQLRKIGTGRPDLGVLHSPLHFRQHLRDDKALLLFGLLFHLGPPTGGRPVRSRRSRGIPLA